MDTYISILLVIGLLLLLVTLGSGLIARLPLSYALIYLIVGVVLSPYGLDLIHLRPETKLLERVSELVVLVSLFSCGLKMSRPLTLKGWAWNSTVRLIGLLMPMTIFAIAAVGHWVLQLSWGTAILLGAILAPTDPVLASEVQLYNPQDQDELRFGITSEGGLNDALAFPFVYFGLRSLEDNRWQNWLHQWVAIDVVWAIVAGVGMGVLVAKTIQRIERRFKRRRAIDDLIEDFTALSTILITYSLTEMVNGYGFLAVFIAGVIMQRRMPDPETRESRLRFIERFEKLAEVGTILLLGSLLRVEPMVRFAVPALLVAGLLLFVIRPLGSLISTANLSVHPATRWLFGWFGIRGVGSIYYLTYSLSHGLKGPDGELIAWITFSTIVISVILHGISATPLMKWYEHHIEGSRDPEEAPVKGSSS